MKKFVFFIVHQLLNPGNSTQQHFLTPHPQLWRLPWIKSEIEIVLTFFCQRIKKNALVICVELEQVGDFLQKVSNFRPKRTKKKHVKWLKLLKFRLISHTKVVLSFPFCPKFENHSSFSSKKPQSSFFFTASVERRQTVFSLAFCSVRFPTIHVLSISAFRSCF